MHSKSTFYCPTHTHLTYIYVELAVCSVVSNTHVGCILQLHLCEELYEIVLNAVHTFIHSMFLHTACSAAHTDPQLGPPWSTRWI